MKAAPKSLPDLTEAIDAYYRGDWSLAQLRAYEARARAKLHDLDRRRLEDVLQLGAAQVEDQELGASAEFQARADRLRQKLLAAAAKKPIVIQLSEGARTNRARLEKGQALAAQHDADTPPAHLVAACRVEQQPIGEGAAEIRLARHVSAAPAQQGAGPAPWRLCVSVSPASRVIGVDCGQRSLRLDRPGLYSLDLTGSYAERVALALEACMEDYTLRLASATILVVRFQ